MLRVLAWMMPHHLVLAVASPLVFRDDKGVMICCTLALASVACALILHMHDKVDERIAAGLAAQEHAQDALVHVVDVVAGEPDELPTPRLRVVPRPRA